jgi:hypothetical protein
MIQPTQRKVNLWVSMPTYRLFATFLFIALIGGLIYANITSSITWNTNCSALVKIGDVNVCQTEFNTWMVSGYAYRGTDGSYWILLSDTQSDEKTLVHELCHIKQMKEGRAIDEIECYVGAMG